MAIIVWILKMIGLLFLIMVGILLFLLLLLLFVPIRYRIKGSYQETLAGEVRASWLFPVLVFRLSYQDEIKKSFRVFGISPKRKAKAKKETETNLETELERSDQPREKEAEMQPEAKTSEEAVMEQVGAKTCEKAVAQQPEEKTSEKAEVEQAEEDAREKAEAAESANEQTEAELAEKPKKKKWFRLHRGRKKPNLWQRLKRTGKRIRDRFFGGKETGTKIWAFLHDEENRKTFRLVKKETVHLIRHLLPVRLNGTVRFGMDDPATTGQILAWISPFYGVYAKHFSLTPVFEEAVLEGTVDARGRIRIGTVLWILICILRDKNFRTLIKKARKD